MLTDPQRFLVNVRNAATDDLLDRITAYRAGMEPSAVEFIENELADRGVSRDEIAEHAARCKEECIFLEDETAAKCSFCKRPAVAQGWGWQRLFRWVPLFPRSFYYCRKHRPVE